MLYVAAVIRGKGKGERREERGERREERSQAQLEQVLGYSHETPSLLAGGKEAWCVCACVCQRLWRSVGASVNTFMLVFSLSAADPLFSTMTAANLLSRHHSPKLADWK